MHTLFSNPKELDLMQRVTEVFLTNGLKAITMDDVASMLNVSKKTLYKYVKNRPDLISKCFMVHTHNNKLNINKILAENLNAVEEKIAIAKYFQETAKKINENVVTDAIQYFPKAWDIYTEYRNTFVLEVEKQNLKKGISEGLYCSQINVKIMARIYDNKFVSVFNVKIFPSNQFKFEDVFVSFICHHLRGITTSKGLAVLEKQCIK